MSITGAVRLLKGQEVLLSITGAVRVIKRQEVLPDGSTLEEHGIIDGSTVNIIIEPEKEIKLNMEHGPFEGPFKVSSSVRVRDLKQRLIDGDIVGFSFNEFQLIISAAENEGITEDVPLVEESLPLHLYGVGDNTTCRIVGNNVQVVLVTQRGYRWHKSFPRNITVGQMKQRIRLVERFFSKEDKDLLDDIWLFVQRGESYKKLDEEAPLGSVLSDNDVIYLVEDRFFCEEDMFPVYYREKKVGQVGWKITFSSSFSDTVLSLKLRARQLLGIPLNCIHVKFRGKTMQNEEKISARSVDKTNDIIIQRE